MKSEPDDMLVRFNAEVARRQSVNLSAIQRQNLINIEQQLETMTLLLKGLLDDNRNLQQQNQLLRVQNQRLTESVEVLTTLNEMLSAGGYKENCSDQTFQSVVD